MSAPSPILTTLSLFLAVMPGLFAWWAGRRLVRLRDDPMLAERLVAYQVRVFLLVILATIVVFLLASARLAPRLVPLMVLGALAGLFPSRKTLFGETWTFTAYLEYKLRFLLAFAGFRYLLAVTPLLVARAEEWRWPAIAVLGAVLFGWLFFGARVFVALLGAKPVENPEVTDRFAAVAARSRVPAQRLLIMDFPGGRVCNAFAIPALPRPMVVFTRTLLDELGPDELGAVYAHELAHLEHMDARFTRRLVVLCCLAVIGALVTVPLTETWLGPDSLGWRGLLLIGLAFALGLVFYMAQGRHREAESDRRAVELCGDPEALVRGLTQIHVLNHLPRRWDAQTEGLSSHPSLANRIRAIRAVAGIAPEAMDAPLVVASAKPGAWAILDAERVRWLEGVPEDAGADAASLQERAASETSVAYGELSELLVKPAGLRGAALAAADRRGRKWSLPLRQDDIATVQAALAKVDTRVNQTVVGDWRQAVVGMGLSVGILVTVLSVANSLLLVVMAGFSGLRPRPYTLGAVGFAALGEAVLAASQGLHEKGVGLPGFATFLAFGIAASIYALYRAGKAPVQRGWELWLLGGVLVVVVAIDGLDLAVVVSRADSLLRLRMGARACPEVVVALLGLAGLVAVAGAKRWRIPGAGALCLLGGIPIFLQSAYFGERFTGDPFEGAPQPLHWETEQLEPIRELSMKANGLQLRLSPQATRFAYRSPQDYQAGAGSLPYVVADLDGRRTKLEADELWFVDEDRVLALTGPWKAKELRLLGRQQDSWATLRHWPLIGLENIRLAWNSSLGRWRAVGNIGDAGQAVIMAGGLDGGAVSRKEFPGLPGVVTAVGDRLMVTLPAYPGVPPFREVSVSSPAQLRRIQAESLWSLNIGHVDLPYREFWISDGSGWQKISETAASGVDCAMAVTGITEGSAIPCLIWGGVNPTLLGLFHLDTGRVAPLVEFSGQFTGTLQHEGRLYLKGRDRRIVMLDLSELRAVDLRLRDVGDFIQDIAVAHGHLAVLSTSEQGGAKVQLFQLPELPAVR